MCESNLHQKFDEISLPEPKDEEWRVEVVDYMTLFGVFIDRSANERRGPHITKEVNGRDDYLEVLPSFWNLSYGDELQTLLQLDVLFHKESE